jgi:N-acetyldiaminopimelate deacetylase
MLDLIQIRKDLHQIPELAFQEFKTKKYIENILESYDSIQIYEVAETGLLAEYSHSNENYLLFRADMDALPFFEKTTCTFQSEHPGIMHACGHDIHMTILLGLIDYVANSGLQKNILFLFQPAEEGKGGAKKVLESEIFKQFSIQACFALHVSGKYSVGSIASKAGIFFANTQEIDVIIKGKSAHVAFPLEGIDTIDTMLIFLAEVKKLIHHYKAHGKRIVCYFGKIASGNIRNAISDNTILEGTVRALEIVDFHDFLRDLDAKKKKIEKRTKSQITLSLSHFYQGVDNNEKLVRQLEFFCHKNGYHYYYTDAEMTGEDFGYFSQLYPSLLFWLGASNKTQTDLHSPYFLPSDQVINIGLSLFKMFI